MTLTPPVTRLFQGLFGGESDRGYSSEEAFNSQRVVALAPGIWLLRA